MGENEQGGMLRTVIVLGLVALIAAVATALVIGLKSNLRTNALMAETMGQNVLKIDPSDPDNKMFHILGGSEKLSYDSSTGTYTLVLSTKSKYDTPEQRGDQGMFYGAGGSGVPKDYSAFLPGDKYYMTADIRTTSDVSLMSKVSHRIGFSRAKVQMAINPDITNSWQHYETKGIRLETWGAPLVWFNNGSDQPITLEIKNVQLVREV